MIQHKHSPIRRIGDVSEPIPADITDGVRGDDLEPEMIVVLGRVVGVPTHEPIIFVVDATAACRARFNFHMSHVITSQKVMQH